MIVAFIPARGGSKRLPRKNIRPFGGRPLIVHTIEQALQAGPIARCIVSTDDEEIGAISRAAGAEVLMRPAELAADDAPTGAAAQHLMRTLQGSELEALVTLQPNCPLRPPGLVEMAVALYRWTRPDSVVSVTRTAEKCGEIRSNRFVPAYRPGTRGQDMPMRYFENGVIYVSRPSMVLERGDLFGSDIVPMELDSLYARGDIDTELDFRVAEYLYHKYTKRLWTRPAAQGEASCPP